jgi:serine/threonine-protein kinase HSL1 (negative regulator of Swe1 kinase)
MESHRANDQKAFYWLLYNYREKQLEDFKPELSHSMSDYHHLKPGSWKKRVSTCQFSQPRANGHGRSVSRFTVISNAQETEAGTIQSYDPYRGSRVFKPSTSDISQAKIVVHRDTNSASGVVGGSTVRGRSVSATRRGRASSMRASVSGRPQSSRGSMGSLQGHRQGTPHARGPNLRHKRGVDFSHVRKRSSSENRAQTVPSRASLATTAVNESRQHVASERPQTPEDPRLPDETLPKAKGAPVRRGVSTEASLLFNEELRHFSSNIAKDCDEAFRSSYVDDESTAVSWTDSERKTRNGTPPSFTFDTTPQIGTAVEVSAKQWETRPLPPLPSDTFLASPPQAASTPPPSRRPSTQESEQYDVEDGDVQVARLALPVILAKQADRRAVSAPAYSQGTRKLSTLPSINENAGMNGQQNEKARIVSAPPRTPTKMNRNVEYLSKVENTIRVVHSPTAPSPVKVPEPLNVRKKAPAGDVGTSVNGTSAKGFELQGDAAMEDAHDASKKRKMSWFRRPSRADAESKATTDEPRSRRPSGVSSRSRESGSVSTDGGKKKSFNLSFWKAKESNCKMTIAGKKCLWPLSSKQRLTCADEVEYAPDQQPPAKRASGGKLTKAPRRDSTADGTRHIEVKQNWLARLFRVKPEMTHFCMTISRKRARQELALLLREWRKYGIRGVQVDKTRNIVFARVGPKNCE